MPDPNKQEPDVQPETSPSNPYRKPSTKPVGRDSDASPGGEQRPNTTPNRVDPQTTLPGPGRPPGASDSTED